jgi:NAD(P)-dependent dehydrogenase (short-subunit alcohol dehydrogenase family)
MAAEKGLTLEEHMSKIAARTALGRLVTADELAYFAAFLASPRSVSLTGEVLALTGGLGDSVYL